MTDTRTLVNEAVRVVRSIDRTLAVKVHRWVLRMHDPVHVGEGRVYCTFCSTSRRPTAWPCRDALRAIDALAKLLNREVIDDGEGTPDA